MNRFTVLLLIGGAFLICTPSAYVSIVPQAGPNPIPINQTSTTDGIDACQQRAKIVIERQWHGR
jgi:hypothetical protein